MIGALDLQKCYFITLRFGSPFGGLCNFILQQL